MVTMSFQQPLGVNLLKPQYKQILPYVHHLLYLLTFKNIHLSNYMLKNGSLSSTICGALDQVEIKTMAQRDSHSHTPHRAYYPNTERGEHLSRQCTVTHRRIRPRRNMVNVTGTVSTLEPRTQTKRMKQDTTVQGNGKGSGHWSWTGYKNNQGTTLGKKAVS